LFLVTLKHRPRAIKPEHPAYSRRPPGDVNTASVGAKVDKLVPLEDRVIPPEFAYPYRWEGMMRLVTRGDLDGLTCAVLLMECELIDDILLVHPQDITDKKVKITDRDVMANIPYHPACGKWFDHHLLTD